MHARAPGFILLGLLVGGALAYGVGRTLCVRHTRQLAERVAMLDAQAGQVQAERDRLHEELGEHLRERGTVAGVVAGRMGKPTFWNARAIRLEHITSVGNPLPKSSARRRKRRGIRLTGKK